MIGDTIHVCVSIGKLSPNFINKFQPYASIFDYAKDVFTYRFSEYTYSCTICFFFFGFVYNWKIF